ASLRAEAEAAGRELVLHAVPASLAEELGKVPSPIDESAAGETPGILERVGDGAFALGREWKHIALLLTESLYYSTFGLRKSKTLLRGDAVKHMIRLGSTALPIVLLLSALIGFTLALQSGLQLVKYGAAIFLADGIGISMVTEI